MPSPSTTEPFDPDEYLREKQGGGWLSEAKPVTDPSLLRQLNAPSEAEMMRDLATADANGDTELAQHIAGRIKATRAQPGWLSEAKPVTDPALLARLNGEQPGLLRRALTWATTPFDGGETDAEKRQIADQYYQKHPGAPGLRKDSSDLRAGAVAFLGGAMPGAHEGSMSTEAAQRMGRFRSEHPVLGLALPLAGGFAQPGMIPGQPLRPMAGPAAAVPAATEAATAVAPATASAAEQAPVAARAVNQFEAAARGEKVSALVKTIDANAGAHLGVDPRDPRFAEALAGLPEEWWNGMGQQAKINKPSQATIDQAIGFYRDRAEQALRASEAAPAAASVAPQVAAETAPSAVQGPALPTLGTQLRGAGDKLSSMPKAAWSPLDLIMGAHGYTSGGTLRGAAEAAAMKALRNYGPAVAGAALKGAGKTVDALPPQLLAGAIQAARAAAASQQQRQQEDWLDAYLREKQALTER